MNSVKHDQSHFHVTFSLYRLDSYNGDNILLKVYKDESEGGFAKLLHHTHGTGDAHA